MFVSPVGDSAWVLVRVGFKGWPFFTVAFDEVVLVRSLHYEERRQQGDVLCNVVVVVFFLLVFRVELREVNLETSHLGRVSIGVKPDALRVFATNCNAGMIPRRTISFSVSHSY